MYPSIDAWMLQSSSTGPGRVNVFAYDLPARVEAGVESLAGAQRKHVVKVGVVVAERHSVADADREHVGDERLAQLIDQMRWRPRRGAGVGPSSRFSQITAPPGPIVPPPVTVPLTVGLRRRRRVARARSGGARLPAGIGAAVGRRGRARPAALAVRVGEQRRNHARDLRGRSGILNSASQSRTARAKSPASYSDAAAGHQVDDQVLPLRLLLLNARSWGVLTAIGSGASCPGAIGSGGAGRRRRATRAARDQEGRPERAGHHAYTTDVVSTLFSTTGAPASS